MAKTSALCPGTQLRIEVGPAGNGLWQSKIKGGIPQGESCGKRHASETEAVEAALSEMVRRRQAEQAAFEGWLSETRARLNSEEGC